MLIFFHVFLNKQDTGLTGPLAPILALASCLPDQCTRPSAWFLPGGPRSSYPIDDDPGHVCVGWPQSIRELSIDVQELRATVPQSTLHDGIRGHLWRIDLQALTANGSWSAGALPQLPPCYLPNSHPSSNPHSPKPSFCFLTDNRRQSGFQGCSKCLIHV